jgi:hypothetical protein
LAETSSTLDLNYYQFNEQCTKWISVLKTILDTYTFDLNKLKRETKEYKTNKKDLTKVTSKAPVHEKWNYQMYQKQTELIPKSPQTLVTLWASPNTDVKTKNSTQNRVQKQLKSFLSALKSGAHAAEMFDTLIFKYLSLPKSQRHRRDYAYPFEDPLQNSGKSTLYRRRNLYASLLVGLEYLQAWVDSLQSAFQQFQTSTSKVAKSIRTSVYKNIATAATSE